jgi:hypothetical protein
MKIRTLPVYSKLAGEAPKEIADNLPAKGIYDSVGKLIP